MYIHNCGSNWNRIRRCRSWTTLEPVLFRIVRDFVKTPLLSALCYRYKYIRYVASSFRNCLTLGVPDTLSTTRGVIHVDLTSVTYILPPFPFPTRSFHNPDFGTRKPARNIYSSGVQWEEKKGARGIHPQLDDCTEISGRSPTTEDLYK